MAKDYGSWSLAELKEELGKRKAKLTGKKAVLVQRLQDYDTLFGRLVNDPEDTYRINTPGPDTFRDINAQSNIPKLSEEDLIRYSVLAGRENLSTSKNMYEENFLMTCRSAEYGGFYFVTGLCLSEMRKNLTYNVTIKLQENTLIEGQCECAAGMGPYAQCKHVLVLIYGLLDFSENKKIKTRCSSTSTLQIFHHPSRPYYGEPVKAENLKLKIKHGEDLKNFNPLKDIITINDEKYKENFKNLIVNFTAQHSEANMPIIHITKPANKKALYQDHDYLEENEEELYLKSLLLDENERKKLETSTRKKNVWKNERVKRMQSSDFGKICKCTATNKRKLAKSLCCMKELLTPAIKHGVKYEKTAIKKFCEQTGLEVQKCGIIINAEHQYLGCTPDALVGSEELLEVKCSYTAANKIINGESVPYLYLCEQSGELKLKKEHDYFYQVQGQLFCTDRKTAYFCVYTIADFCIVKIDRDNEFIRNMINKLKVFYDDYYKDVLLNKYLYNVK